MLIRREDLLIYRIRSTEYRTNEKQYMQKTLNVKNEVAHERVLPCRNLTGYGAGLDRYPRIWELTYTELTYTGEAEELLRPNTHKSNCAVFGAKKTISGGSGGRLPCRIRVWRIWRLSRPSRSFLMALKHPSRAGWLRGSFLRIEQERSFRWALPCFY